MQSHIGCICSTFLHCAFSNVSSNNLPERMRIHTGCICLTFLHCVFSNVFSKCLPEKRQNYTGCICLAFLHCVFSYVTSNPLLERMHNHMLAMKLTPWSNTCWLLSSLNSLIDRQTKPMERPKQYSDNIGDQCDDVDRTTDLAYRHVHWCCNNSKS